MGEQWHFDPDTYFAMVRSEIPGYDRLQQVLADSTADVPATAILDLGSGTGVTAQRVLSVHPGASLVGVDASEAMLAHARELVPGATFVVSDLEAPLPAGPFEVVVSAFAVHHLDGAAKADLFARVAAVLAPGGRFALCDVVVPACRCRRWRGRSRWRPASTSPARSTSRWPGWRPRASNRGWCWRRTTWRSSPPSGPDGGWRYGARRPAARPASRSGPEVTVEGS